MVHRKELATVHVFFHVPTTCNTAGLKLHSQQLRLEYLSSAGVDYELRVHTIGLLVMVNLISNYTTNCQGKKFILLTK
jgi:hypothetical protein